MNHPSEYRNQQVVVLGLARSGQAVAKVFHSFGADVTVNDKKERSLCPEADELEALGIRVLCGGHPDGLIRPGVALVVKNPGINYSIPPVAKALELGIEVVTEVEVAYYLCEAPIIGITGSNGKTTTTTLVGNMLKDAGFSPVIAGNIGRPLCDAARDASRGQWLVVELSSFQLKGTRQFRPRIACLLNLYETHLDYHGTMEDYRLSKAKIFENQDENDIAVLNMDDGFAASLAARVRASVMPFSAKRVLDYGVFTAFLDSEEAEAGQPLSSLSGEGGLSGLSSVPSAADNLTTARWLVFRDRNGQVIPVVPVAEIGILGEHNVEDALAAVAIALAAGAGFTPIAGALREFRGVEHRQEYVREVEGVRYYNDSKSTNPTSAVKAMESFAAPIVWIGGGLDRGSDYSELTPYFAKSVKAVVALGQTRGKILEAASQAGIGQLKSVDTGNTEEAVEEAVRAARAFAAAGDVVLFSPACASWDMFSSYEERGRMFKASVHNL